ncbi:MAG: protein kinase domain-containing protein [Thermoanaerobaculia bacterium]
MTAGSGDGPPRADDEPSGDAGRTRTSHDLTLRLAAGTQLAGRYRVEELVGVGAMGLVYRAFDEQLEIPAAVKVLRVELATEPRLLDRFRRELVLARQVTHRNAVRIHDIGHDGDVVFLTMDYVAGRSLREVLDKDGPLPPQRAEQVTRQLAAALEAAHAQGVIHRDLKPENVLLGETGEAFITDFGVARSVTTAGLTRAGAVVGTLDYLSPEQARGEEVDGRSDLYALGLLLFEMLSGRLPFAGGSREEVLAQRLAGRPRTLRQLGVAAPPHLRRVIARCLERQPSRRYPSATELLADLDGRRAASLAGRAWVRGAAVALAILVLVGAGWWAIERRRGAPGVAPDGDTVAGAPRHAVAALPLQDETGRAELAWLSGGVAEMLTAALAESPELRVVDSPRVARTLEDLGMATGELDEPELRQLSEVLAVDRLIGGRLRSLDPGVQVDLRLVTTDLQEQPSEPITATASGPLQVPELIARLAAELQVRLEVAAPLGAGPPPPDDPQALRAYSLGTRLLDQGDAVQARPALEEAVEASPGYAPAWAKLAQAYDALGLHEEAVDASARAVSGLRRNDSRLALEARALDARLRGEPEQAQRLLVRLVEHFPNDSEARVALAEAHGEQGDLAAARSALAEVVERDPLHPRAWFLLAKYTILAGDSRTAIDEHLVHAMVIQNKLKNRQGQADVLNAMGVAYHRLGELDQAADHYGRAALLRRDIGDQRGHATSLRNVAMVDTVRGRYEAAESSLEAARQIFEQIGDQAGAAALLNDLGVLDEERGDYRGALDAYRRALKLTEDVGDRAATADSYNNVGYAYYLLGEYDNAEVYWRQASDLYTAVGNEAGTVQVTQNLGLLDLARGAWNRAAAAFLEALEGSRRLELPAAEAVSLGALGELALLRGRFSPARESIDDALARVREIEDPRGLTEFTLLKAELELALGRSEAAEDLLDEAERWLADSPNREQLTALETLRGRLALARQDPRGATERFAQAERTAALGGGVLAPLRAALGTGRAELASGDTARAVELLERLSTAVERLGHVPLLLDVEEALAEARLRAGDVEGAAAVSRQALQRVENAGGHRRAFRLYLLLGSSLDRQLLDSGATALESARQELERLRAEVAADHRAAFEALADVREAAAVVDELPEIADVD